MDDDEELDDVVIISSSQFSSIVEDAPAARDAANVEQNFGNKSRRSISGTTVAVVSTTQGTSDVQPKQHAIAASLEEVTYITSLPWGAAKSMATDRPHYGVTSVSELTVEKWEAHEQASIVALSQSYLLRVYPKGLRTNSSNFDPQHSWNVGAQLVALNIQTNDDGMRLNSYRFRVNGRCGMVLKPRCMREPDARYYFNDDVVLTVRVICGVQLPKPDNSKTGEVIDPYVVLKIKGVKGDDTSNEPRTTRVVDNNGFNPQWNETFTFNIRAAEMAMLWIQVMEKDPLTSEFIGDNAIPITALREGYRCVPLYMRGVQLPPPTCLFCHFSVANRPGSWLETSQRAQNEARPPQTDASDNSNTSGPFTEQSFGQQSMSSAVFPMEESSFFDGHDEDDERSPRPAAT